MRLIATLLALLCTTLLWGQAANNPDPTLMKAKKYLLRQQYPKVVKMAEKQLQKNRKAYEWYFLKGAAQLGMSEQSKYQNGKEDYFKLATKTFKKGVEKDESGNFKKLYSFYIKKIVEKSNKEAEAYFYQERYSKCILIYRDNYELTGDTISYTMEGLSYYKNGAEYDGIKILKNAGNWMYAAKFDGKSMDYKWEPYAVLGEYYLKIKQFDSARHYTEMGLEMFSGHPALSALSKKLLIQDLQKVLYNEGQTVNYIEIVNKALHFFPSDSFFLRAQNSYFLNKLTRYAQNNEFGLCDSGFTDFYEAKHFLLSKGAKNKSDDFLIQDSVKYILQCLDYALRTNTRKLTAYFFKRWFTAINNFPKFTEYHAQRLLSKPDTNVSRRLTAIMFEDGRENYPKNAVIKKAQLDYFNSWMKEKSSRSLLDDKLTMCDRLTKDFGNQAILKTQKLKLLNEVYAYEMGDGNMDEVWQIYHEMRIENAPNLTNMLKEINKRDFEVRFVGTSIPYITRGKGKIAATGWAGNSAFCDLGYMPDSTSKKVIDRINYFRQNAGVLAPMYLTGDRMQKSQAAAIMYAGKGVFTRSPETGTHPCISMEAQEAAKIIQGILDNNPAQSITNLMADKSSEELVNRAALLNIGNEYAGFGCAEDNCVFWLLDTAFHSTDQYHQFNAVTWPPQGATPIMLLFGKWSFALNADLSDAKVGVKLNGNSLEINNLSVQKLPGISNQTIVYKPMIDAKNLKNGDVIEVEITLKNNKKIKYKTELFEFKK